MASAGEKVGKARARWERATAIPMMIVAIAFIVAYSIWVLMPEGPAVLLGVAVGVLILSWVLFVVDYVVRLTLSPHHRWLFVRHNLMDLFAVVIPIFRAFRLLRSLREIDYFRRGTGDAVRTRVIAYAALFAVLFVYMLSLAELQVERYADGATITTFGDAVWWACVTMATVGYGDTYPVTAAGRLFAVMLMVGGVAIVGTASAVVVSYLNETIVRRPAERRDSDESAEFHGSHDNAQPPAGSERARGEH